MVFTSLRFAIFYIFIFLLYWSLSFKFKNILLLFANLIFYSFFGVKSLIILIFISYSSYRVGLLIDRNKSKKVLVSYIILIILLLFGYKYVNRTSIIPIGLSFYSFTIISYLIDVYKGKINVELNLLNYLCYVTFFPTITSGPIERAGNLLNQIKQNRIFVYKIGVYSLKLFAWGFFKKVIIANNLSEYVNFTYNNLSTADGFVLLSTIFFYSIQLYCDFSGYSDMAKGLSGLLGFDIKNNFSNPYLSTTIKEFWSKWHISLSTWLRDYVYIPLGGNKKGKIVKYRNLIITFFVSGVWHGSNVTFLIWGLLYGFLEVIEDYFGIKSKEKKDAIWFLRICFVFTIVSILWIPFRANSLHEVFYILKNCFNGITNPILYLKNAVKFYSISKFDLITMFIYLIILITFEFYSINEDPIQSLTKLNPFIRWTIYLLFGLIMIFLYPIESSSTFLYFAF